MTQFDDMMGEVSVFFTIREFRNDQNILKLVITNTYKHGLKLACFLDVIFVNYSGENVMGKFSQSCIALLFMFGLSQSVSATVIDGIFIFGDSLSDSGAFVGNADAGGGGKFTTNPGPVWTELLGAHYGQTVVSNNPNNLLNTSTTGNNYAQGGAQVTSPIGIGQTASPQNALSISTQVTNYLAASPVASPTGLFTVWGGANDLFYNLGLIGGGFINPVTAAGNLLTSATSLVGEAQRLITAGAGTVLIPNLPDIGTTPSTIFSAISAVGAGNANLTNALVTATLALRTAANTSAEQAAVKVAAIAAAAGVLGVPIAVLQGAVNQTGMLFSGLTAAYNGALTGLIAGAGLPNVVLLDVASLFTDVLAAPSVYGLGNVTGTACNTPSSLSCTAPFFAAETAFFDFLFADAVHPTSAGHALIASLAITTLNTHFGIPEPSVISF